MLTYKLLLSSRERVEVKGLDAADAMQKTLQRYPGTTIRECYSGCKEWHTVHTPQGSYQAGPAWIDYEVPPHFPFLPPDPGLAALPLPDPFFSFMDDVPAIVEELPKPVRKRQVAIKERTHA